MKNIADLKHCYGCGACIPACPVDIISLHENSDGFYVPKIDHPRKCTSCGLCLKVCAYKNHDRSDVMPMGHAGWSLDTDQRLAASSGGVAPALADAFFAEFGDKARVLGVRYNPDLQRAEHYIAANADELRAATGSKYLQSYTEDAFRGIDFKDKDLHWLIFGTPCQISSLRRLAKLRRAEDRCLFVDFFCHGVPSRLLLKRYISREGLPKDVKLSWRDKTLGWHDSWVMTGTDDAGTEVLRSAWTRGDEFYRIYLDNICFNRCCYGHCRFKGLTSDADLRLGDFWGKKYENNEDGISAIVTFNERGRQALACDTIDTEKVEVREILRGQMRHRMSRPKRARAIALALLRMHAPLKAVEWTGRIYKKFHKEKPRK